MIKPKKCKYFDIACQLGDLAPDCDMTCELNTEAKKRWETRDTQQDKSSKEE